MKVTVIGYWGAYPAKDSATSSYLLEKDGFSCLLDCGSGALSKLQSYINPIDLDAVVLSHYHSDHIADIGVLQHAWLVQNLLRETDEVLPIYGHSEDERHFKGLTHQNTEGIAYDPTKKLEVGPFQFEFMRTNHPVPCYGMRITDSEDTLVYTADSSFKEEWITFSHDADLLITDCNFYEDQDGSGPGHMTSKENAQIAARAGVSDLILSHLPHFGDTDQLAAEAKQSFTGKVQVAYEGLVWGD